MYQCLEDLVHEGVDLLWAELFRERTEPFGVTEHDGHLLALTLGFGSRIITCCHNLQAARFAEFGVVSDIKATIRAVHIDHQMWLQLKESIKVSAMLMTK